MRKSKPKKPGEARKSGNAKNTKTRAKIKARGMKMKQPVPVNPVGLSNLSRWI